MEIAQQLGITGCTIKEIDPGTYGFEGFRNFLESNAETLSDSGFEINEDTVKAGIRKYLRTYADMLENGLKITNAESGVPDRMRPDFKARDANGNLVLIECKGTADEDAVWQAIEYRNKFKKEKGTRALLVSFKTTNACRKLAHQHDVELFECDLTFSRV
jgi:RecB family endonuclease NucS